MAIYVDELVWESRGRMWCHLLADSRDELHRFARDLPSSSFHARPARPWRDHYDLTEAARRQAVKLGAIEITFHEAGVHFARRRRSFVRGPEAR